VANLIFRNASRDPCNPHVIEFPVLKWQAIYEKIAIDEANAVREAPRRPGGIVV